MKSSNMKVTLGYVFIAAQVTYKLYRYTDIYNMYDNLSSGIFDLLYIYFNIQHGGWGERV